MTKAIGGLDVDKLVNMAFQIKTEKDKTKFNDIVDSIYLVTDVDDFYSKILNQLATCKMAGIQFVISNPCFELWLYYSYFEYDQIHDFVIPDNNLKISSRFKTYLHRKKARRS